MYDFSLACNIGEMQKMAAESVRMILISWEGCNIKVCAF